MPTNQAVRYGHLMIPTLLISAFGSRVSMSAGHEAIWKYCFCHCPSGEQQYPWQSHLNFHHWDIKAYQRYHDFHILLHLVPCSLSSWRVLPPVSPFILSSWSACLSDLTHPVHLLDRDLAVSVHLLASSFCSKQASASRTQTLITPN